MKGLYCLAGLLGSFVLLPTNGRTADKPAPDWEQVRSHQPPGLTLTLSLPKDHYFLGELILGKITITNAAPTGYVVSDLDPGEAGTFSRLRYFGEDSDGHKVSDPLMWAENALQNLGGMVLETDLGTWSDDVSALTSLRFDHPGRYTIWAWTDRPRIGKASKPGSPGTYGASVDLVSDKVTIAIEPRSAAEEAQLLADAQAKLNQPATCRRGALELGALQTPASHAILRTLICDNDQNGVSYIAELGLMESPNPQAEGAALLDDVSHGKVVVGRSMQWVYSWLERGESTNTGGPEFEKEHTAAFDRILQAGQKATGGSGPVYVETLWVAYSGLFPTDPRWPAARTALVAHQLELKQAHKDDILRMWSQDLKFQPQQHEFSPQWEGEDLLPLAREALAMQADPPDFYDKPHGKLTNEQQNEFQQYYEKRTIRDDGLIILANVKPAEARPIILADLQRPKPRLFSNGFALFGSTTDAIPTMPMPELDEMFRTKLAAKEGYLGQVFWLIDHFGSAAIEKDVLAAYDPEQAKDYPLLRQTLVRYLKRCDPSKVEQIEH
jgi:hypothetical protein